MSRLAESRATSTDLEAAVFAYSRRLRRVHDAARQSLDSGMVLTLDDVARVAAMEKHAFCRYFRQNVGITYGRWITRLRVDKAKRMMRQADWSLAEVAAMCGFVEYRTFSRRFKKTTGMSPSQYRRTHACLRD